MGLWNVGSCIGGRQEGGGECIAGGRDGELSGGTQPGGFEKSGGSWPKHIDVSCDMSTRFDLRQWRK